MELSTGPIHCSSLSVRKDPPMSREPIRIKRSQGRSRQPPRAGGLMYAVAHQYHLGFWPARRARLSGQLSAEPGWRCWGSDSGSAWLRTRPYSARILRPPSLHLPSAPSLELADLNSHSCHSKGGDLFAYPSKGREQQRQHASLGYLDNHHQQPATSTTPTPTHNQRSPRTQSQSSRIFNGRPWSGPAELF